MQGPQPPAPPTPPPWQTPLTWELSDLLWEGVLCRVLVLGWWAGQMALKLLLLLNMPRTEQKKAHVKQTVLELRKENCPSLLLTDGLPWT